MDVIVEVTVEVGNAVVITGVVLVGVMLTDGKLENT